MNAAIRCPKKWGCSSVGMSAGFALRRPGVRFSPAPPKFCFVDRFSCTIIARMKSLIRYDAWCCESVQGLLKWLDEWLSISQKYAERSMIVLYVLLVLIPSDWKWATILSRVICGPWVGWMMWILHRRPAATRKFWEKSQSLALCRIVLQCGLGLVVVFILAAPPYTWSNIPLALAQVVYVVFFYATDITSDGGHGKRRKLFLAELKKMFGTEWIPKPMVVPR
jgi:hypothetical protein